MTQFKILPKLLLVQHATQLVLHVQETPQTIVLTAQEDFSIQVKPHMSEVHALHAIQNVINASELLTNALTDAAVMDLKRQVVLLLNAF
jgi:hypothetical protein